MYDIEGLYRVFLWYRLGKYQENTNRYHTEIPNRDTTLPISSGYPAQTGLTWGVVQAWVGQKRLNRYILSLFCDVR